MNSEEERAKKCHCKQFKCKNKALPHFNSCTVCYNKGKSKREIREFWQTLSKHFNGVIENE